MIVGVVHLVVHSSPISGRGVCVRCKVRLTTEGSLTIHHYNTTVPRFICDVIEKLAIGSFYLELFKILLDHNLSLHQFSALLSLLSSLAKSFPFP